MTCQADGESHLNKCKIALYVALLHKPVNAYNESDVNLMSVLAADHHIQDVLNRGKTGSLTRILLTS